MGTTDAPENQEPSSTSDNWVTVFGFSQDQAYAVLQFMSRHGEVVRHQVIRALYCLYAFLDSTKRELDAHRIFLFHPCASSFI